MRIKKKIADFVKFMHKKYPTKFPIMSCYGCLLENCANRSITENRECEGYRKRKKQPHSSCTKDNSFSNWNYFSR